jgi:hypothetical protein
MTHPSELPREGKAMNDKKETYPAGWKHATIHLNPATGEMHSDGDHSVREWIEARSEPMADLPRIWTLKSQASFAEEHKSAWGGDFIWDGPYLADDEQVRVVDSQPVEQLLEWLRENAYNALLHQPSWVLRDIDALLAALRSDSTREENDG